jgi:hypothetical protein
VDNSSVKPDVLVDSEVESILTVLVLSINVEDVFTAEVNCVDWD